ncbi:hypothetical protein TRFO_08997 [Tritrichomonas foetus]|uniref:AdoMet activation domain-containing protein n=1 Tax=Tritrichomonas foetus TaxID=1144522 RepID=A0A1J4JHF4_9EUKA|nr:hypothetical protein TRFO_08997 [Tritrichomonas foetus]|eukprot:OHS98153.1 hypothetical protein TRFO_08997 [Tritrichomonas foetus]
MNPQILKFQIEISPQQVQQQLDKFKVEQIPFETMRDLISLCMNLFDPVAAISLCQLEHFVGSKTKDGNVKCFLKNDPGNVVILNMNDAIKYLKFPVEGFFFMFTVGRQIDDKISEYKERGNLHFSKVLSIIAISAISEIRKKVIQYIEKEANINNFKVGPYMNPGSVKTWELFEQEKIYQITNAQRIGMKYHENGFVDPVFSSSGLVPIGSKYKSDKVTNLCFQCDVIECPLRNEDFSYQDIEDIC